MGTKFSRPASVAADHEAQRRPTQEIKVSQRRRKRKRSSSSESQDDFPSGRRRRTNSEREEDTLEKLMSTPKKKVLKTTSQYIYDNLFKEGKDSDITIHALGISWKLHRLYLCQSPYFAALFSGRWSDGDKNQISLTIDDENITRHSLHVTLGSFYRDDVTIEPHQVVSVLAAAALLQLDGLISQCTVIMNETINKETVVKYYEASEQYGCIQLAKACIDWLLVNLLIIMPETPSRLREIPPSLLEQLIGSPHLFVMQTEFSVYVLLRLWLFLIMNPSIDGESREIVNDSQTFFRAKAVLNKEAFLDTDPAKPYQDVFRAMRIEHMMMHHLDMEILFSDRLLPTSWLNPGIYRRWMTTLRIDSGVDRGPQDLSEAIFEKECYRCGRMLNLDGQHMWRWTGFNSGLDLIVSYEHYRITIKRNTLNDHTAILSNHQTRNITYRVTVVSLNDQKQKIYEETSGIKQKSLALGQTTELLLLDPVLTVFPLYLSFSFVVSSPLQNSSDQED